MRSSTSSSEPSDSRASEFRTERGSGAVLPWLAVLLFVIAGVMAVLEIGTRIGFRLVSRIESRTMAEAINAHRVRPMTGGKPSILLLGNSLMLEDVDYPELQQDLAGRAAVSRFVIEQTYYYDWYFGIRRLFSEGVRPRMIVLGIQPAAFVANQIRGDYSAFYLISMSDLPSAAGAAGYDLTKTSNLVFARFSLFYAGRNNLRNFILNKVEPGYGALLHDLVTMSGRLPADPEMERISAQRLTALKTICAHYGTRFLYVIPPAFGKGDEPVVRGGARSHVTTLEPFRTNELPETYFRDGFHLNEKGARLFTSRFAEELRQEEVHLDSGTTK